VRDRQQPVERRPVAGPHLDVPQLQAGAQLLGQLQQQLLERYPAAGPVAERAQDLVERAVVPAAEPAGGRDRPPLERYDDQRPGSAARQRRQHQVGLPAVRQPAEDEERDGHRHGQRAQQGRRSGDGDEQAGGAPGRRGPRSGGQRDGHRRAWSPAACSGTLAVAAASGASSSASSTRPSRMRTTRSARAATTGSWVTSSTA
jgi:hypothetical protein